MRRSLWASRNRILALGASLLVSGSALAAAAMPAQAAPAPAPAVVTVTAIADQSTNPLSTPVDLALSATDTDVTGLPLTFTMTPTIPGLTITPVDGTDAAITGTITQAGIYSVTATDVNDVAGSAAPFTWTADNTIAVPSPGAQTAKLGTPLTNGPTIKASDNGGATALPLTYSAPALPTGLTINPTSGLISGTPTLAGTYPVTVTATDSTGATGTSPAFNWVITPNTVVVKATAPKAAWTGVKVSVQPTATDSAGALGAPLTWSAATLPAGLAFDTTTGLISGRPTKPSAATTTVTATDALGTKGSTKIVWNIVAPVVFTGVGPRTTTVGVWKNLSPYQATDRVPGDKPTYSATGLPPGMAFQPSPMLLLGWPTTAGTYNVIFHERGSLGSATQVTFKLTVTRAPNRGGTGQIRLALDGKCLLDPGNKTANGTRVQIANCVSGATERWTVVADGTIRANGRCLDIAGSGSTSGRQLQLTSCGNANPRQLWTQGTDGQLINPASGLCATDPGSSRNNGAAATMGACHARSYEQWTLPAQPILTALGGSCADDHFSSGVNGNVVDMFWCNGTAGQAWTFETDGTLRMFGNKCIIVRNKKAVLWTCGSANQSKKWTVVRVGAMSSELTEGGVCLAIPSLTSARGTLLEPNGTQLITSKCSRTDPRDLWHIA